jgi:hypothetical protein
MRGRLSLSRPARPWMPARRSSTMSGDLAPDDDDDKRAT